MTRLLCLIGALLGQGPDTNLAGTGKAGPEGDGGPARLARLDGPFDVAYDSAGNLFLSDIGNQRIRRIDARTGSISTVAGVGAGGFSGDGGPATAAKMDEPYGIALDDRGGVYFADRLNRRVRRVDASGTIATVAGDGSRSSGGDGGPATGAGLIEPNDVALDGRGRLFIADVGANLIRVVDLESGVISRFAGDGKARHAGDGGRALDASIHGARAVAVGPDGAVWVLERQGNTLRSIDPATGAITTRAGTGKAGYGGDGGPPSQAMFNGPKEFCFDHSGRILVVDTENHAIRRIDLGAGRITTVAGDGHRPGPGDDLATTARLDRPHGVAVARDGTIVIGDTNNHRIRAIRAP